MLGQLNSLQFGFALQGGLALLLTLALGLDALVGDPRWLWSRLPHPVVLMGRWITWLDDRLNVGDWRRVKGCFALAVLVIGGALIGWLLGFLGPVATVLIAATLLAQKSLEGHLTAVADALRENLPSGRQAVSMIVSRDTGQMTEAQVARSAIESAAENLSDGVFAPAFWFLVAGLPGLVVYKIVNTADSMIGYRNARYAQFGWAAARFDDLLNWGPARLTALTIALRCGALARWKDIAADARRHRSPNAGWPEAAAARALGVALAGPRSYDGVERDLAWVNARGLRDIGAHEIEAAVDLLWKAWSLGFGICAALAALSFV